MKFFLLQWKVKQGVSKRPLTVRLLSMPLYSPALLLGNVSHLSVFCLLEPPTPPLTYNAPLLPRPVR